MSNASAVPLSSSVTIASGLNMGLGYLLDCNKATYRIKSGSAWHLLHIKAERISANGPWSFSLQSKTLTELATIWGDDQKQAPHFVDKTSQSASAWPGEPGHPNKPYIQNDGLDVDQPAMLETGFDVVSFPMGAIQKPAKARLTFNEEQGSITWLTEVGVHIYPIAYHRITGTGSEIVQCARSDYHFWPVPTLPVWSQRDNLQALAFIVGCAPDPDGP